MTDIKNPLPFGAHAFVWTPVWDEAGAARAIGGAASLGLDFVEIPLLRLDDFPIEATKALLAEHSIGATTSLGLPKELHMPFDRDGAVRFLGRALELTEALGADALSGALYGHLGTLTREPPTREEIETCANGLREVAKMAADRGLRIGIEALNRYETYLFNTAEQVDELLDAIDEDNVFAHLDTYHMNIEGKGYRTPIERLGDRLGYIHLSESDRGTPGTANVNWDEVFPALAAIGYEGPLVMESFVAVNEDIIGATCIWRDIVGDPDTMVGDGLAFLQERARVHGLLPAAA
jgi:D-psicose/D-tagatose/L-ribulose 3-epimerase